MQLGLYFKNYFMIVFPEATHEYGTKYVFDNCCQLVFPEGSNENGFRSVS